MIDLRRKNKITKITNSTNYEGAKMKEFRLKSKIAHKIFYRLMILFYLFLSFGLIPLGYISLVLMIIIIPAIFLFKKLKNNDDFD